jgi:class 3 adenylate cyclase
MAEQGGPSLSGHDPIARLRTRLKRLYREAGEPSVREISKRTGRVISHTTVHVVLRCVKTPRWGQLELVVEALGGNADEFRSMWIAVRDAEDGLRADAAMPLISKDASPEAVIAYAPNRKQTSPGKEPIDTIAQYTRIASGKRFKDTSAQPEFCRRTVAVLKVVGLTEMKESSTEAAWLSTLGWFYGVVTATVTHAIPDAVVKYLGDGLMLVFETADVANVLNMAIEVQEAVKEREATGVPGSSTHGVLDFRCSIGISTGDVLAFVGSSDGFEFVGTVVDRAFRLSDAASPGAIFIDDATQAAAIMARVRSRFGQALNRDPLQYQGDAERAALRGFNEPVAYYEILWDKQRYGIKSSVMTDLQRRG